MNILRCLVLTGVMFVFGLNAMDKASTAQTSFKNNEFDKIKNRKYQHKCPLCSKVLASQVLVKVCTGIKEHFVGQHPEVKEHEIKNIIEKCKKTNEEYPKDLRPKCPYCTIQFNNTYYTIADCCHLIKSHLRICKSKAIIGMKQIRQNPEQFIESITEDRESQNSTISTTETNNVNFENIKKRTYKYKCPICYKIKKNQASTPLRAKFKKHLQKKHPAMKKQEIENILEKCKSSLRDSTKYPKDLKPKCPYCSHTFKSTFHTLVDCRVALENHLALCKNKTKIGIKIDEIRNNPKQYVEIVTQKNSVPSSSDDDIEAVIDTQNNISKDSTTEEDLALDIFFTKDNDSKENENSHAESMAKTTTTSSQTANPKKRSLENDNSETDKRTKKIKN